MKHRPRHLFIKEAQRGQSTIEFIIWFPVLFAIILFILLIALNWNANHVAQALELERASLIGRGTEGMNEADNLSESVFGSLFSSSFHLTSSYMVVDENSSEAAGFWFGEGYRVSSSGQSDEFFLPYGLELGSQYDSGASAPKWEFEP